LKASRASAGLIGLVATSAVGAAFAGGKGAKDFAEAQKQNAATDEKLQARKTASARRHDETDQRVLELGQLQQECQEDVVDRMRGFLRRHEKQVRDGERLFADGVDVTIRLPKRSGGLEVADIGAAAAGAAGSVAVGTGTGVAVNKMVHRYGIAGTGKKISELYGAAGKNALEAFAGGGPIANGGGGIKRGKLIFKGLTWSSGLLAGSLVAVALGKKALADAQAYAAAVSIWCGKQELFDAYLDAVDMRVDEHTTVLNGLRAAAVTELEALEALESVPFDIEQHGAEFQRAWVLVLAVRDVANAPLLTDDGELDERSETVIVKYRPMMKENEDA
jgi:hypothetical protein